MEALVTHQGLRARFLRSPGSWAIQPETLHICVRLAENGQGTGSGTATTICVVWPDPGGDTMTLDRPGDKNTNENAYRLTDIPVKDG